ncbi:hypothetical protein C8J57DRAFT_1458073 [Mycena rebaudengoi]|nr:hypothetical protein C8J57DRAFT_1458073 [Mycena rebaudengoi]
MATRSTFPPASTYRRVPRACMRRRVGVLESLSGHSLVSFQVELLLIPGWMDGPLFRMPLLHILALAPESCQCRSNVLDLDATPPSSSPLSVSPTTKTEINTELLIAAARSFTQKLSETRRLAVASICPGSGCDPAAREQNCCRREVLHTKAARTASGFHWQSLLCVLDLDALGLTELYIEDWPGPLKQAPMDVVPAQKLAHVDAPKYTCLNQAGCAPSRPHLPPIGSEALPKVVLAVAAAPPINTLLNINDFQGNVFDLAFGSPAALAPVQTACPQADSRRPKWTIAPAGTLFTVKNTNRVTFLSFTMAGTNPGVSPVCAQACGNPTQTVWNITANANGLGFNIIEPTSNLAVMSWRKSTSPVAESTTPLTLQDFNPNEPQQVFTFTGWS